MVQATREELKASAFLLVKIRGTFHVKLSSQQGLEILARLIENVSYDFLAARQEGAPAAPPDPQLCKGTLRSVEQITADIEVKPISGRESIAVRPIRGVRYDTLKIRGNNGCA